MIFLDSSKLKFYFFLSFNKIVTTVNIPAPIAAPTGPPIDAPISAPVVAETASSEYLVVFPSESVTSHSFFLKLIFKMLFIF